MNDYEVNNGSESEKDIQKSSPHMQTPPPDTPPPTPPVQPDEIPQFLGEVPVQRKSGKKPVIIAVAVVSIIFIAALALILFRGPIKAMFAERKIKKDPLAALTDSIEKTKENISNTDSGLPNLDQFKTKPTEHQLDLVLDGLPDSYYDADMLVGSKFHLNSKTDYPNKELKVDFGMETPFVSVKNSSLYVNPDTIAISVPDLYKKHEYLTVNTETFARDWNRSEYGEYDPVPEGFDLKQFLKNFFEVMEKDEQHFATSDELNAEYQRRSDDIISRLKERMELTYIGKNDKTYEIEARISSRDMEDFIKSYMTLVEDMAYDSFDRVLSRNSDMMGDFASDYSYGVEYYMSNIEEMTGILKDIRLEDDAKMTFMLDKKTLVITQMELHELLISSYNDDFSSMYLTLDTNFEGKKNIIDDMSIDLELTPRGKDPYGPESIRMRVMRTAPQEEKMVGVRWEIITDVSYNYDGEREAESLSVFMDFSWDKEDKESRSNMSVKIGAKDKSYNNSVYFTLRGNLQETEGALTFTDGKLSIMNDSTEMASLFVDYSGKVIEPGTIAPDLSNSIDFFKVDPEDLDPYSGITEIA